MNSKKQRTKNRRRARKLADQAWESVDADNLDMAMKLIRRATDVYAGNPILWNDRGLIHMMRDESEQATKSFLAALALSSDFAEAYAHLAGIASQEGKCKEAAELITCAADLQPGNSTYAKLKDAYVVAATRAATTLVEAKKDEASPWSRSFEQRVDQIPWDSIEDELTCKGIAVLPRLLAKDDCRFFRELFEDSLRTGKQVIMDKPHFGKGVYKYLDSPLPDEVVGMRRILYAKLVEIVNRWMRLFGSEGLPTEHAVFLEHCVAAGQTEPTPLLLKYVQGGFNAAHRDLRGEVFFPLQVAIVLSPQAELDDDEFGFQGGEFFLRDGLANKRSIAGEHQVTLGLGDAVVFCTRERLTPFLDQHAIIPVSHGAKEVRAGTRYVLAVPFHDYLPSKQSQPS